MKIYRCHVCNQPTVGRRSPGWYIWLILSLVAVPFGLGLIMLLFLFGFAKRCPRCNAHLIFRAVPK